MLTGTELQLGEIDTLILVVYMISFQQRNWQKNLLSRFVLSCRRCSFLCQEVTGSRLSPLTSFLSYHELVGRDQCYGNRAQEDVWDRFWLLYEPRRARGKKAGHEGEAHRKEDGASTSEQHEVNDKHIEDSSEETNARSHEHAGEEHANENEGGQNKKRSRGRGKGRGRSQYHHHEQNNHRGTHVGTPPSNILLFMEQPILAKQPPGPRMPDGTRGFSRGRGKPLSLTLQ